MKKTIKAADIKAIAKKFNLNEDEQWDLNELARFINAEKSCVCADMDEAMRKTRANSGVFASRDTAAAAIILYFTEKRCGRAMMRTCIDLRTEADICADIKAFGCDAYFQKMFLNRHNPGFTRLARYFDWSRLCGDHHWGLADEYWDEIA